MSKAIVFTFVVMMAVAALSAPAEESVEQLEHFEASVRLPRATCDLLSAFGVADSACAAGCLGRGFRGGWCDKGVCHCRR